MKLKKATYNLYAFLVGKVVSSLGATVYGFVVSMYILQHTGSSLFFAINILISFLPRIITSPIVGVLADRYSRKKLVLLGMSIVVTTLLIVATYSFAFGMSVILLYVTTLFYQIGSSITSVSFTASITNLIDEDRIQKAMSFNQFVLSSTAILGPILGGILFGFVPFQWFFVGMAVMLAIDLCISSTMHFTLYEKQSDVQVNKKDSVWKGVREGWTYVQNNYLLKKVFFMSSWINLFFTCIGVGGGFVMLQKMFIAPTSIGIIEGFEAVGMLSMALLFSMIKPVRNPLRNAKWSIIAMGCVLIVFIVPLLIPFSSLGTILYLCLVMMLFGIFAMTTNMPLGVWMQKEVDEHQRGRVFGLLEMMAMIMMPVGTIAYGILFDYVSASALFIVSGIIIVCLSFYLLPQKVICQAERPNVQKGTSTLPS